MIDYPRIFRVGDPGIPDEGIIVGQGGGTTLIYDDLVILPNRNVLFMTYATLGAPTIPNDFSNLRLLTYDSDQFELFVKQLNHIEFRSIKIPPPSSNLLEYIVLIEKGKEPHAVIWARDNTDAVPNALILMKRSIRNFLAIEFIKSYANK